MRLGRYSEESVSEICHEYDVCQFKKIILRVKKVEVCRKDSKIPFSFGLIHSVNYIIPLNIRQQHQHGCPRGSEKVLNGENSKEVWPC